MASRLSYAITRERFGDVLRRLKEILRKSPGKHLEESRLEDFLKKSRRDFHFKPI